MDPGIAAQHTEVAGAQYGSHQQQPAHQFGVQQQPDQCGAHHQQFEQTNSKSAQQTDGPVLELAKYSLDKFTDALDKFTDVAKHSTAVAADVSKQNTTVAADVSKQSGQQLGNAGHQLADVSTHSTTVAADVSKHTVSELTQGLPQRSSNISSQSLKADLPAQPQARTDTTGLQGQHNYASNPAANLQAMCPQTSRGLQFLMKGADPQYATTSPSYDSLNGPTDQPLKDISGVHVLQQPVKDISSADALQQPVKATSSADVSQQPVMRTVMCI